MLQRTLFVLCFCLISTALLAQKTSYVIDRTTIPLSSITREDLDKLPHWGIDLNAAIPFGKGADFNTTGFAARVEYSSNPFGFIKTKPEVEKLSSINDLPADLLSRVDILDRRLGWQVNAGFTHLPGKKEDMFEYDNLSILHLFGGIDYDVCIGGDIEISAGPALGSWGNGSEFGYGASVGGYYYIPKSPILLARVHEAKKEDIRWYWRKF